MRKAGKRNNNNLKAVDFFCSGGGMSYGLQQAGIDVLAGIDIDLTCKGTYEYNLPNSKFIHADVTKLKELDLQNQLNLKKNDDKLVLVGCSPCQYWTLINTKKTKSQKSKNLLQDFEKFVHYFNPGYVVVENVPGILSKKEISGLGDFIKNLENNNYIVEYKVVNLCEYGIPQTRKRFSLIATRVGNKSIFPKKNNGKIPMVKDYIGKNNGFPSIPAGHKDLTDFIHTTSSLSDTNLARIKNTSPNGGTRLEWANDSELQLDTYKRHDDKSFSDTYGRMRWDKPAPTITTKFHSISNGRFGHPDENRALSLREGATLQTFPKDFVFRTKSIGVTARIIGNAVPPQYAKRLGDTISRSINNGK